MPFKMIFEDGPGSTSTSYVSRPIFTGSRRVFVGIAPFSLSCARLTAAADATLTSSREKTESARTLLPYKSTRYEFGRA